MQVTGRANKPQSCCEMASGVRREEEPSLTPGRSPRGRGASPGGDQQVDGIESWETVGSPSEERAHRKEKRLRITRDLEEEEQEVEGRERWEGIQERALSPEESVSRRNV